MSKTIDFSIEIKDFDGNPIKKTPFDFRKLVTLLEKELQDNKPSIETETLRSIVQDCNNTDSLRCCDIVHFAFQNVQPGKDTAYTWYKIMSKVKKGKCSLQEDEIQAIKFVLKECIETEKGQKISLLEYGAVIDILENKK